MKHSKMMLLLVCFIAVRAHGQAIDNTLAYKNINSDSYFRLNYDNDFFSAKDKYYTQGINAELVTPWLSRFPVSKLLVNPKFDVTRYGLALQHNGYTPSSIGSDAILYGDRPFAAALMMESFLIATDTVKKQRFTAKLTAGVVGPAAGGKQMQTEIHRALNNVMPHGWDNQVSNDLILNYQVGYERQLVAYRNIFSLSADAQARVGTLSDKATLGATMIIGYFDSPFGGKNATANNFRIYAYDRPAVNAVAYDATLQGGMFNNSSPYVIASGDVSRITLQNRYGFVIAYRRIFLEYFQSVITKEFSKGDTHVWGGVQLSFGL